MSQYKDFKIKVVSWFSLVIGQNASRQLATSSENLIASAQFLVALATSESQFRALFNSSYVSLPSSAKQQREMTKSCVIQRTETTTATFFLLFLCQMFRSTPDSVSWLF